MTTSTSPVMSCLPPSSNPRVVRMLVRVVKNIAPCYGSYVTSIPASKGDSSYYYCHN